MWNRTEHFKHKNEPQRYIGPDPVDLIYVVFGQFSDKKIENRKIYLLQNIQANLSNNISDIL